MRPNFEKQLRLCCGIVSLLAAITLLVLLVLVLPGMSEPNNLEIIGTSITIVLIIFLFWFSTNSFIKYGACLGIDYSISRLYQHSDF